MIRTIPLACFTLLFSVGRLLLAADEPSAEQIRFFEEKIRPVIAESCYECHSDKKQQGDVRLDRRDAVFPHLIAPGEPDKSRLLQVLKHDPNDTQMPPKGKLPQDKIDLLTEWVRQGAPWPADATAAPTASSLPRRENGEIDFDAAAKAHWAYRPITRPVPPRPAARDRVSTPVDQFVLAQLEAVQLSLAPEANRETLIRRLYADLLGMRPTYDEVQAFVADSSPTAVSDLVDRLLASPRFGERWARMWLDIARYADTKGYVFTDERRFAFSYTYRDYVIEAFNSDKPYDQFIIEQLAADKLNLPPMSPELAAMGFLTLGPRFIGDTHAIIDDRIDVVSRGLMGMTTACARCHDHKYDPIPIHDYYSLYGVFASSHEPEDLPQVGAADTTSPEYQAFAAELAKRNKDVTDYLDGAYNELQEHSRTRAGDFLMTLAKKAGNVPAEIEVKNEPPLRDKQLELWQKYLERELKPESRVWSALAKLRTLPADGFAAKAAEQVATWTPEQCHPAILQALKNQPPQSVADVVRIYGQVLEEVRQKWVEAQKAQPDLAALPDADTEQLRQVLYGDKSAAAFPRDQIERYYGRDHREKSRDLRKKVAELVVTSKGSPPHGMVLFDNDQPMEPVVFERGNPGRHGPRVPRRMPRIVGGNDSPAFTNGSGRLELAQRIVSPDNPLTARVFANRVWLQLFGTGLVTTPSDFGVRTELPTHPELLDWMAGRFVDSGWSTKTLIREIVLSSTYRQSIIANPAAVAADPENRLYWRQNRRRFQFEQMRDSMLAAAGALDDRMQGRPVEIEPRVERKQKLKDKVNSFLGLRSEVMGRRSIYSFIDRNNFSSLLRTFDYPSPDTSSPQRPNTVVPQQALFGLNSPFVTELAQIASDQVAGETPEARVESLFRLILARSPAPEEASWSVSYLSRHPDGLWQVAQALLLSNEFQFVE